MNQGIDDVYFQYNISCLHHASISSFFSLLVLSVKFFLKIQCKTEHVFNKKRVTRFDKK